MFTFYKTELGFRTLKLRDLELNARQRRLLVLIGTEDFHALSHSMQQRIASPDLLQQLMDLGLIIHQKQHKNSARDKAASEYKDLFANTSGWENSLNSEPNSPADDFSNNTSANPAQYSEIQSSQHIPSTVASKYFAGCFAAIQPAHNSLIHEKLKLKTAAAYLGMGALDFEALKKFMAQHLQQYCGLMAKTLILKIHTAEKITELKILQIQWITMLQESRISPKMLNDALQEVNLSIRILQTA